MISKGGAEVVVDINQPGDWLEEGIYRAGPIVSRVEQDNRARALPEGTLLYGQLWTEGLIKFGKEAVMVRYTEALLPDGRRVPICFILGDQTALITKSPGSKPGATVLRRRYYAYPVEQWP